MRSVPLRLPSPGARRLSKLRLRLRAGFGVRETVRALEVKDFKGAATLAFGGAVVTVTRAETKDREFQLDYEWSGPFRGLPEFLLLDARGCRIHPHGGSSSGSDRPAGTLSTGARGGFLR